MYLIDLNGILGRPLNTWRGCQNLFMLRQTQLDNDRKQPLNWHKNRTTRFSEQAWTTHRRTEGQNDRRTRDRLSRIWRRAGNSPSQIITGTGYQMMHTCHQLSWISIQKKMAGKKSRKHWLKYSHPGIKTWIRLLHGWCIRVLWRPSLIAHEAIAAFCCRTDGCMLGFAIKSLNKWHEWWCCPKSPHSDVMFLSRLYIPVIAFLKLIQVIIGWYLMDRILSKDKYRLDFSYMALPGETSTVNLIFSK